MAIKKKGNRRLLKRLVCTLWYGMVWYGMRELCRKRSARVARADVSSIYIYIYTYVVFLNSKDIIWGHGIIK